MRTNLYIQQKYFDEILSYKPMENEGKKSANKKEKCKEELILVVIDK